MIRPAWSFSLLLAFALLLCTPSMRAQTSGDGNPTTEPVRVSGGVMASQRLTKVDPVWPEPTAGSSGVITLHVIVRKDGTVRSVDVVAGDPPYCTVAMSAVKQWTYKPYLLNGEPVEVDTTVTIDVQRNGGSASSTSSDVAPTPRRIRVASRVLAGHLIKGGGLVYPQNARDAGVSGTVVLKIVVTRQGAIQDLSIVSGPEMLQSAAMDAVKQWVYRPYLLNGEPVEVETTVLVNFNLGPGR